jgi:hypothetical protein
VEQQRTCGQGLAEHSSLPAKLGELTAAVAETLELHMKALDLSDANAKQEHDAYRKLVAEHRRTADELQVTAQEMAGYRDLPMGRHDENAMSDPKLLEAFERFVSLEQELLWLLQERIARDQKMLIQMPGGGSGRERRR